MVNIFAPTPRMKPSAAVNIGHTIFAKKTLQTAIDKFTWQCYTDLANKTWQRELTIMNKEEILQKARTENAGVDEVKRTVEANAALVSHSVGLAMCMLLNFLDSLILQTDVIGDACWIIYGTMVSTNLWVQGFGLKKKSYLIGGAVTTVFVILLTVFLFLG